MIIFLCVNVCLRLQSIWIVTAARRKGLASGPAANKQQGHVGAPLLLFHLNKGLIFPITVIIAANTLEFSVIPGWGHHSCHCCGGNGSQHRREAGFQTGYKPLSCGILHSALDLLFRVFLSCKSYRNFCPPVSSFPHTNWWHFPAITNHRVALPTSLIFADQPNCSCRNPHPDLSSLHGLCLCCVLHATTQ